MSKRALLFFYCIRKYKIFGTFNPCYIRVSNSFLKGKHRASRHFNPCYKRFTTETFGAVPVVRGLSGISMGSEDTEETKKSNVATDKHGLNQIKVGIPIYSYQCSSMANYFGKFASILLEEG